MRIYEDTRKRQFFHCFRCGFGGDMIKFLSHEFDQTPSQIVDNLTNAGFGRGLSQKTLTAKIRLHSHDRQRKVESIWELASGQMRRPWPKIKAMLRTLGLHHDFYRPGNVGPDELVGCIKRKQLSDILSPNHPSFLRGKGWKDLIVIPAYGSPGKIQSLLFIGRDCDTTNDVGIYSTITPRGKVAVDAGYIGGNLLPRSSGEFALLTDHWLLAVQLQYRSLKVNGEPLPIAAWINHGSHRTDVSADSYESVTGGKDIVIWSGSMNYDVIGRAVAWDADISRCRVSNYADLRKKTKLSFEAGFVSVNEAARRRKHWVSSLKSFAKSNPEKVSTLMRELDSAGLDAHNIADVCGLRVRWGVKNRRCQLGAYTLVSEPNKGWLLKRWDKLVRQVTNFNLLIYSYYTDADGKFPDVVRGRVKTIRGDTPFLFYAKDTENPAVFLDNLRRLAAAKSLGRLIVNKKDRGKIIQYAELLRQPHHRIADVADITALFNEQYGQQSFFSTNPAG